jgi:hypothetical protein
MPEQSIAERLFLEADRDRHQELLDLALDLIRDHEDHAPRIDTGEWSITAQEKIDDLRQHLNIDNPRPLRRVQLDHDSRGDWYAILDPYPRPFPWDAPAKHGKQGDQHDPK